MHDNTSKYLILREKYPVFVYESYAISSKDDGLDISFRFSIGDELVFRPRLFFPGFSSPSTFLPEDVLHSLVFHLGMVEMISYWKCCCSPRIHILPFRLTAAQQTWWKRLFRNGLGEFFYTNGISISDKELPLFSFDEAAVPLPEKQQLRHDGRAVIVPVGGGKDSVVSLELLKNASMHLQALVINQRDATRQVLQKAGVSSDSITEVERSIDPLLLELNEKGFLNGHTPFSAMLAFVSVLVASLKGIRHIALSNESSANEPNIPGTTINHQYSKSVSFEADFRCYVNHYMVESLNYFSLLRPLNELQIGALFSQYTVYHSVFKSCNVGSKTDSWCAKCPKCLFTYIILSPFLPEADMQQIFGASLLDDEELKMIFDQLTGLSEVKPFECVGTLEEVNAALLYTIQLHEKRGEDLPALLRHYRQGPLFNRYENLQLQELLIRFSREHFLGMYFEIIVREALQKINVL